MHASTHQQTALQLDALRAARSTVIREDSASGASRRGLTLEARSQSLAQAPVIASDDDYDAFGDVIVKTLKTPGQTSGHRSLIVKLPRSGVVLSSGDLYHTRQNNEQGLVPRVNDRPNTLASMDRFARIRANTNARVVIQHSSEDFASMPVFPKYLD